MSVAAKALEANGFKDYLVPDKEKAKELALNLIPSGSVVGVGGSVTIRELGLIEELEKRGFKVIHHWLPLPPDELSEVRRKELTTDVFLSSSNAVTLDGKLVNIDGAGNRVAAMIFGPKRVIVVAGRNKIVRNVEEGISRTKNIATIANSIRLNRKPPCVTAGYCVDCRSPERACNILVVLERKPSNADYHVILVNEDLGF
ncbi:MAG: lactate utilization protein [Desulfurococcaceae archaeon]